MRKTTLLAIALVWAMTPFAAHAADGKWKWSSSPMADGNHCWMGVASGGAKLTLHATSGMGNFVGVASPDLAGMTTSESGTLTFAGSTPRGQRYRLAWRKGEDDTTTYVANGINEDGIIALLKGFVMADAFSADAFSAGVSVVVGTSGEMRFPAAGADQAAKGFAGCWDQL